MARKARKKKNRLSAFIPETLQVFIARRLIDSMGGLFLVAGFFILLSLLSYDHADPSWNTARFSDDVHNWFGYSGAYLADLFLQTLGIASFVFSVTFSLWGWRIIKRKPLSPFAGRLAAMIFGVLMLSIAFAAMPSPFGEWLTAPYLGGSGGMLMLNKLAGVFSSVLGGWGHMGIAFLASIAGIVSTSYGWVITRAEWKRIGLLIWYFVFLSVQRVYGTGCQFCDWVRHYGDPDYKMPVRRKSPKLENLKKKISSEISENKNAVMPVPQTMDIEDDSSMPSAPIKVVTPSLSTQKTKAKPQQAKLDIQEEGHWDLPDHDLLQETPILSGEDQLDESSLRKNAEFLQNILEDFNVKGDIVSIHPGPVVTLYEFEPAPGVKTSRVISLSDDIARSMAAVSVRAAVIPGRNVIGIELPNKKRQIVYLREIMGSRTYEKSGSKLPLVLGKDIGGQPVIADLARMPHLLVAGTTGSGKSVAVNTMILSLLYRHGPDKCRFLMIDPKMLELSMYDDIPHLLSPVVTDPGKAVVALKWVVQEMEERYRSMSKLGVRNIEGYNARLREARDKGEVLMRKVQTGFDPETGKPVYEEQPLDLTELPYIVVVVDEFADLMLVAGKDVENAIQRIAQMARAAGIHLIMATQRPSVDVITGVIKANFPTRISFQVTSKIDSRTILGDGGAEQLLGMGDMLYMAAGGRIKRVHGPFVSDDEVEKVVSFLKTQGEPAYLDELESSEAFAEGGMFDIGNEGGEKVDELYDQAVALVARERKASTSFVQRYLQIGYNRAARIVEEMERQGVIGPANHVGKREVLVGDHSGE